jgi:hypothetical protein
MAEAASATARIDSRFQIQSNLRRTRRTSLPPLVPGNGRWTSCNLPQSVKRRSRALPVPRNRLASRWRAFGPRKVEGFETLATRCSSARKPQHITQTSARFIAARYRVAADHRSAALSHRSVKGECPVKQGRKTRFANKVALKLKGLTWMESANRPETE